MAILIPTYAAQPAHEVTVELSGTQFRLRFVWRERLSSWYLDVRELDGTAVALGRRLSPGFGPLLGLSLVNGPEGLLFVTGPDPYRQEDLGDTVLVYYYEADEYPAGTADNNPVTIEIS